MDDVMDLNDEHYLSSEDMDQLLDDVEDNPPQNVEDNPPQKSRPGTKKRLTSSCWKNFSIIGEKGADGKHKVRCKYCKKEYSLNLHRSGTNTMRRHSEVCLKTPGSTPRSSSTRKIDMLVFRDMIAAAIIEHNLPYSFVEYKRISTLKIECWLRDNRYSEDEDIANMVEAMRLKFQKYWEEYSEILAIAAVFDPRLKFSFLEYCFKTLDPFTYQAKIAHLRKKMYQLFGAYQISQRSIATSNVEASVDDIPSGYSGFYAFSQKTIASGKSPLDRYLDEPLMDILANKNLDVLVYWRDHSSRFKELSSMACDVLSIPITTVASESSFSIGSRVLNKYRSCLLPTNVQALICARNWLRGFQEIDDEFDFIIEEEIKKHEEVGQ